MGPRRRWLGPRYRTTARSAHPSALRPSPGGWQSAQLAIAASVVEGTPALVCVVDAGGRVTLINPSLLTLTGYREREVLGQLIWDILVIPEDWVPARAAFRHAVATGITGPVEADWRDRHGGLHRIAIQSSVLRGADQQIRGVAYVGADVTEQRRQQAELRQRAETDELTGLRNRAAVLNALHAALTLDAAGTSRLVGVLFCDLDGFKQVNDEHGHLVGDAVLIEIGRRLLAITPANQVVSRLGGDEFLILIPDANPALLTQLSGAIETAVRQPIITVHGEITIGVSVGTALGRAGDDASLLIEQADRHMYGVKTSRPHPRLVY